MIFRLDDQGHPTHLQVLASVPNNVFNQTAIQTIAMWLFRVTDMQGHLTTAGSMLMDQVIQFSIYGATMRAKSIINWICDQPPPQTLIVISTAATTGIRISENSNKWVDIVHMPNPHHTPLKNGWVNIGFCIDGKGRVTHTTIQNSSPKGLYDKAAIAALKTWDFDARTMRGEPNNTCGLSYHIPVIGQTRLAQGPAAINQRPTAIQIWDLSLPKGKVPPRGHVTLRLCIDKDGSVSDVRVIKLQSDDAFAQAAIKMLHVWQYWPRTVNGKPQRTCNVQETVIFKLGHRHLVWAYPSTS